MTGPADGHGPFDWPLPEYLPAGAASLLLRALTDAWDSQTGATGAGGRRPSASWCWNRARQRLAWPCAKAR